MPDLPSGTVTFLFTDIEGSTRLLAQLGRETYGAALADHQRLLREAFAKGGGREIDTQGDAFFVAFASANDAVRSAVQAQRSLASHSWPDGIELGVRMALHTGEPAIADDRYLGLAVHRAARICAAGHGGQVLVSDITRDLIEDNLADEVRIRDLGEHRLKDFDRPERLFQLVVDGLPDEFPPLRTLGSQPIKATPFAGQETELAAAAQAAIARHRLFDAEWWKRVAPRRRAPTSMLEHALWDAARRPSTILTLAALLAAALFIHPLFAAVALVAYAGYAWRAARRVRFSHGIEALGWRVHSLARIARDEQLRVRLLALGGAIARVARLRDEADRFMSGLDRKQLAHRLEQHRVMSSASEHHLRAADALARRIATLDELAQQKQAFRNATVGLEAQVGAFRERLFEARLTDDSPDELNRDVRTLQQLIDSAGAALHDAYRRAHAAERTSRGRAHASSEAR